MFLLGKRKKIQAGWFAGFLMGFGVGIALICLKGTENINRSTFLDEDTFRKIMQLEADSMLLFFFCLLERMKVVIWLLLMTAARVIRIGAWCFWGYTGLCSGVVSTVLAIRYGIVGLLLYGGCLLPQQLLILPGFILLLGACTAKKKKGELVSAVVLIAAGCGLEAFVNPALLQWILEFLMG